MTLDDCRSHDYKTGTRPSCDGRLADCLDLTATVVSQWKLRRPVTRFRRKLSSYKKTSPLWLGALFQDTPFVALSRTFHLSILSPTQLCNEISASDTRDQQLPFGWSCYAIYRMWFNRLIVLCWLHFMLNTLHERIIQLITIAMHTAVVVERGSR